MDNNLVESGAIEQAVATSETAGVMELNELALAFVGGGIAELVGV
jgi:hypothetical protein